MHNDADPKPLERQLRREAQELFSRYGRHGSAAALADEHRRRARSRRVRIAGATTTAVVVIAGAMAARVGPERDAPSPREAAHAPAIHRPVVAHEHPPAPQLAEAPVSGDFVESLEPIPFLLTGPDAEGRLMIAVGVYVPPRVERVNLDDLPPLEQAAVRRVLEIDEEEIKPTI